MASNEGSSTGEHMEASGENLPQVPEEVGSVEETQPMTMEENLTGVRLWMTQMDANMLQIIREMKQLSKMMAKLQSERPSNQEPVEEELPQRDPGPSRPRKIEVSREARSPAYQSGSQEPGTWVSGPTRPVRYRDEPEEPRNVRGSPRDESYGGYDMRTIHRMYGDSLRNTRVSKVPDFKFETAYMTWHRLLADVPVPVDRQRALMALAFEGVALKIFEQTALISVRNRESPEQLWQRLREKLCNKSHIISLRSQFMNIRWNEKRESIAQYSTRLRNMAMNLPDEISDDMMTNMFIQGLPNKLRMTSLTVQGSFDEVVSRISLIANEMGREREAVRAVAEYPGKDEKPTKPGSSARGLAPITSPSITDRRDPTSGVPRPLNPLDLVCFYCKEKGHIIRYCEKRLEAEKKRLEAERKAKEQAQGNENPGSAQK